MMKLILASASPRRAEVLRDAGLEFEAITTSVDEALRPNERAEELVQRLAEAKARSASARAQGPAIVVGADTEVVVDSLVLGKPASADDARDMLRRLSGRTHRVVTGLVAIRLPDGATREALEATQVTFAPLSPEEIEDYVASGEPFDKAGAYAIQGRAGRFVTRVDGCYFNVVGLPLARLYRILRELGWQG
ncbi:MAG TPA: Maf family protein [Candidatus Acidoferrales bacterium]|nr:Maf family protein [Candidatus Acidoferrales bacterium]